MNKLPVSISPHLHSGRSSRGIMQDVIIALIPAVIASTIIFGFRALILIIVTVAACVISEYVTRKILKRPDSIHNLTAVVTGILLALNLPVTLPFWMAILGGVIAIVIVKEFFGGVGQNFVNPAITARIILMMSFAYVPTRRHFIGDLFFSLSDRSEDSLVIGYVFGYTRGKSR